MDFDVNLMRHDRCTLVRVQGEIDVVTRPELEKTLTDVIDIGQPLVVDMRHVTFCDSSGLNAVVGANRRASERAVGFALVALPPRVRRVFKITGIDQYIPIYETLGEATDAVGA